MSAENGEKCCWPRLNQRYHICFTRASERRFLLIGGSVMHFRIFIYLHISSSHLHILCSSHLHISFSYLHMFTSSHFQMSFSHPHIIFSFSHLHISSSHLLIFTSADPIFTAAHLHICTHLLHFLSLTSSFYLLSLGRGRCQRSLTKCNLFARNEVRSAKTAVKLQFNMLGGNPFARNEGRSAKTAVKFDSTCSAATSLREMRVDRQKVR